MTLRSSWSYLFLPLAIDAFLLVRYVPDAGGLASDLTAPRTWVAEVGADAAAATLAAAALWCVGMWLAVGIVATVMVGLPGLPGRLAAGISTALLPAVIRRAVASAAGVGVMLAPIAADARTPDPGTHTTVTVCPLPTPAATAATPALPTTPTTPVPPTTLPAPMWPLSASPSGLAGNSTSNSASNPATGSIHVNVNPGDSLWEIAAERLGPTASSADVARAWRRIYALNHDVIGGDPSSIRPGQSLSVPTDPKEYR